MTNSRSFQRVTSAWCIHCILHQHGSDKHQSLASLPGWLCENQSCLWDKHLAVHLPQARNYTLLWTELTLKYKCLFKPFRGFYALADMARLNYAYRRLSWLPVCDGAPFRLWKQNTIRIALLYYMLSYSVRSCRSVCPVLCCDGF